MYEITHISLGQKSPYGLIPGNVGIIITPHMFQLVASVPGVTRIEEETFRRGPIRLGLATAPEVTSALLVWRFDGGSPLTFDTPFNVCVSRRNPWGTPERAVHEGIVATATLQDGSGIVRCIRAVTVPPRMMTAIEATVQRQIKAANAGFWSPDQYSNEVQHLYRRWPTSDAAMRAAIRADLST